MAEESCDFELRRMSLYLANDQSTQHGSDDGLALPGNKATKWCEIKNTGNNSCLPCVQLCTLTLKLLHLKKIHKKQQYQLISHHTGSSLFEIKFYWVHPLKTSRFVLTPARQGPEFFCRYMIHVKGYEIKRKCINDSMQYCNKSVLW